MHCNDCSIELPDDAHYCYVCGRHIVQKGKAPAKKEGEILRLIHNLTVASGQSPTTELLARVLMQQERAANDFDDDTYFAVDELRRSHRRINNFVAGLEAKRYVYRVGNSVHLRSEAEEFFNSFYESTPLARKYDVIPAQVPVRGNVHAGPGTPVEFNDESIKRIPVPDIRLGRKMYALKVVGVSMKSEGILDGDYVIIEEFIDSEGPKPNEIVVARYVELADVMKNPEIEPDERIMFGHTLKRFKEEVTAKPKRYRLSRLETPDHNPFLIEAAQVELVGRIASLYRDYR